MPDLSPVAELHRRRSVAGSVSVERVVTLRVTGRGTARGDSSPRLCGTRPIYASSAAYDAWPRRCSVDGRTPTTEAIMKTFKNSLFALALLSVGVVACD